MTSPYFGFAPEDLRRIESDSRITSLEFHETLDSTNTRALRLVRDNFAELPALVLTANQTAGRGRGNNPWHSGPGALTFSLAIEPSPSIPAERLPLVSLATGLAVCETLAKFLPRGTAIGLKWPNDVLLDLHKVCGILVEAIPTPSRRLVIGIGLNVNNELPDIKSFDKRTPTSLTRAGGRQFSLADIFVDLLTQLDRRIDSIGETNASWLEACREFCVLSGRTVHVDHGTDKTVGHCHGIGSEGQLLIEVGGKAHSIFSGSIVEVE